MRTSRKVKQYFYVKTSPVARQVQRASWARLMAEYPFLCDKDTFRQSHGVIPNDVQLLGVDTLALLPTIDLITAG